MTERENVVESEAADGLIAWYGRFRPKVPAGVLAGMLVSAAAELLSSDPVATRELFVEIAHNAWERWRERRPRPSKAWPS